MKWFALIAVALAVCVAGFLVWSRFSDGDERSADVVKPVGPELVATNASAVVAGRKPNSRRAEGADSVKRKKMVKKMRRRGTPPPEYTPEEQRLSDAVQSALDADDFEQVVKSAREALKSSREEVRQEAVDALSWFGEKALVELTKAMSDKSAAVAESARTEIETVLTGMDDQEQAFVFAATYLGALGENADAATMLSGVMSSAGMQLVDPDDPDSAEDVAKAKSNRIGIVEQLEELMKAGGSTAASAREIYESISGEEWSGSKAAMKWADDIEEPAAEPSDEGDEPDEDTLTNGEETESDLHD